MKTATKLFGAGAALTTFAIGAATLNLPHSYPGEDAKEKRDRIAAALDALEQQLQRRFHDRNNVTFGFERVIRDGARRHGTVLMNKMGSTVPLGRKTRQGKDGIEIEVAPGEWLPSHMVKQMLHPENEEESRAVASLSDVQVAIYTAGLFLADGKPERVKGPAYLKHATPDAPAAESISGLAVRAWATRNDLDELRQDGWTYRLVKVKADDQSCVACHSQHREWRSPQEVPPAGKIGDPIGLFLIGVKL